jgi:hypothetical protein
MKLIELVNARFALGKLVVQDLPIRTAYKLMKLTDECNRHLAFYGQEIGKFNPEENPERLEELNEMEIDVEKVAIDMTGEIVLSASDIKALVPLIELAEG